MPSQQPNLEEQFNQPDVIPVAVAGRSKIFMVGKIIILVLTINFLIYHLFRSSLFYLPIGFTLIVGFFLFSRLLLKRTRLKLTILNKENIFWYYFKNVLLSFTIILLIFTYMLSYIFFSCRCIFVARNIFTNECKTFTGFIPWYYREDSSCEKQNEIIEEEDKTADWQTYRNEKWNYEIKYPQDWTQWYIDFGWPENTSGFGPEKELQNERSLRNSEIRVDVGVSVFDNLEDLKEGKGLQYRNLEEMIINGVKAIKTTWSLSETPSYITYLYNQNQRLEYSIECFKCPSDKSLNDIYNKVINTFKFIASDQTNNWQTYLNDKYGFETKYPTNYNVKINSDEVGLFTARFVNQQGLTYYNINVTENTKSPKLLNFITNPECYEQIREDRHNDMYWIISWWKCSSGNDKNSIAAYTTKGNYVFEILLDSDLQDSSIEKIDQILSTFKFIK